MRYGKIYSLDSESFRTIVQNSKSLKEMLDRIGLGYRGHSYEVLKQRILDEGLKIPNGNLNKSQTRYMNIEEVLVENSPFVSTNSLKKRLLKEGVITEVCAICGQLPIHNDKPLTLQLDHINGIHNDHRKSNLRLICPNCHSQTETYSGKNTKKVSNVEKWKKKCPHIFSEVSGICMVNTPRNTLPLDEFVDIVNNMTATEICESTGITIYDLTVICRMLSLKMKRKKSHSKFNIVDEELISLIPIHSNEQIGRMYGVSGRAVGKRLSKLGISRR